MGVDSSPRTPMTIAIQGAGFWVGLGQAAARWEAHPLGANGGPKGEGEGSRAGRWGCRGLRTGEAKRGRQTGTANYEHEEAEVPGVRPWGTVVNPSAISRIGCCIYAVPPLPSLMFEMFLCVCVY